MPGPRTPSENDTSKQGLTLADRMGSVGNLATNRPPRCPSVPAESGASRPNPAGRCASLAPPATGTGSGTYEEDGEEMTPIADVNEYRYGRASSDLDTACDLARCPQTG